MIVVPNNSVIPRTPCVSRHTLVLFTRILLNTVCRLGCGYWGYSRVVVNVVSVHTVTLVDLSLRSDTVNEQLLTFTVSGRQTDHVQIRDLHRDNAAFYKK